MSDRTLAYWSCAAVAWIIFTFRLRDLLRAPRDRMRWAVCATLFACASIMTWSAPAAISALNQASGIPNLAALVSFSLVVVLGAAARVLVAYWQNDADRASAIARRWLIAYSLVILALVILFALGDAPVERRTDFEVYYATTPYIAQFVLLYLTAMAVALVSVAWRCWHWSRTVGPPWLRRGLRLIAVGSVFGIGVSTSRTMAVVARWFGGNWDALNVSVAAVLAVCGLAVAATGFALPAWGGHLSRAAGWAGRYRAYRRLYPLWDALRRATPAIELPTRIPWWDLELRLTRRLTEINDGRLALRHHIAPGVTERARRRGQEAHLTGIDLDAAVEAARLQAALAAKKAGLTFPVPADEPHQNTSRAADGTSELAWLDALARAFTSAPRPEAETAPSEAGDGADQ